jgi:phage-related protein
MRPVPAPSSPRSATTRRRQWRDYRTALGGRPVKDFLDRLTDEEVAAIVAGMKDVAVHGLAAAKHLRGDLYEVRADAPTRSFRLLFSAEGRFGQVLLSLSAFVKKTQKTPPRELVVAEARLRDWRARGAARRRQPGRAGKPG